MRILGVAAVVAVVLVSGCSSDGEVDGDVAEVMCEEFVKDKLKSPGSAEFSDESYTGSGSSWSVSGVVDSENGFGAMLRADYSCQMSYVGDDEWRASSVVVTPR